MTREGTEAGTVVVEIRAGGEVAGRWQRGGGECGTFIHHIHIL